MAGMMLPSELAFFRLDYATARSSLRTGILAAPLFFLPAPPWEIAVAVAAAYQITPLKRRCLAVCRAPLARIVHGWRDGLAGAFRTGVGNGLWCVGCCVPAMLVLVAVGMMSYWWMALAGAFIFVEKRAAFPWAT